VREGRRYYRRDLVLTGTTEVPCLTLDDVAAENEITAINLLKLDAQGGEHAVLRGADGLLSHGAIDVVLTEFFFIPHYAGAPLLDAIWSLLRGYGYEIYDLFVGRRGRNGQARWGDAVFVSPAYRAARLDTAPDED
jgi:hypothetical protein